LRILKKAEHRKKVGNRGKWARKRSMSSDKNNSSSSGIQKKIFSKKNKKSAGKTVNISSDSSVTTGSGKTNPVVEILSSDEVGLKTINETESDEIMEVDQDDDVICANDVICSNPTPKTAYRLKDVKTKDINKKTKQTSISNFFKKNTK